MLTGEIRSQIDQIWNAFWSGGISNPLEVIEQITYLLFLKRLDEQEIAEELKANREKKPMQKRFFPEGKDGKKRSFQDYRWNRFKNSDPRDMYAVVSEHVFPWLRTLGGNGTTYSKHMEGARFTIPTPALLAKVVDMIDKVPMKMLPELRVGHNFGVSLAQRFAYGDQKSTSFPDWPSVPRQFPIRPVA